jgi:hypothetical protein
VKKTLKRNKTQNQLNTLPKPQQKEDLVGSQKYLKDGKVSCSMGLTK